MFTTNRRARTLSPLFALFLLTALFGLLLGRPAPAAAACGVATVVGNEAQLSAAITDFNGEAGPCNYIIQLSADIVLTTDLPNIANTNAGVNLTILGVNHVIDGDNIIVDILKIDAGTTVSLNSLIVQGSDIHGVLTYGNLTVRNSTIRNNLDGAGIYDDGTSLLVTGSTFSGNFQGIYAIGDELTLINSTIANNDYIGVAIEFETVATLTNVTITGNEAGLVSWGTTTINNSLFAENVFDDCYWSEGTITIRYSLLEHTDSSACDLAAGNPDGNGNIVGENAFLAPLGNYGGPTHTAPLLTVTGGVVATSPGIDDGSNALAVDESSVALLLDQRGLGFPRIVNVTVDMGAVEGPQNLVCPAFPVTVINEAELNAAILCYNLATTPGTYFITLGADIDLTASTRPIDNDTAGNSLVIEGDGRTIDAQDQTDTRPIQVNEDTTVAILDATITGGNVGSASAIGAGGGVLNSGTLALNGVTVTGNTTEDDGGGIQNDEEATLFLNDSVISDNTAVAPDGDGAGISNDGLLLITRSTISGNQTFGDGGVYGGGILNVGALTLRDSTVDNNSVFATESSVYGGGISNEALLVIINSTISNNSAEGEEEVYGGGISSFVDPFEAYENDWGAGLALINSTVSGNSAIGEDVVYGGGLYFAGILFDCCYDETIPATIINSTISNNSLSATDDAGQFGGGGAYFYSNAIDETVLAVTIHNSILANSTTDSAPGGDCDELNAEFESEYSLYEDTDEGACGLAAANPDGDGNIVGQDPALGALGNNGGPTFTHLPTALSLAIDNGSNPLAVDQLGDPLEADQRGFTPRIVNGTVDIGSVEVGASGPAVGYCPVDPNVGTRLTVALGTGQGSPTKGFRTRKLIIPNSDDVVALYGQLAAIETGVMKYVRFLPQGEPKIQIQAPTSAAYRSFAIDWWGTDLPADANWVKGQFFWGAKGNKSPRAFVLWPTYETAESYANVFETFDESSENHVAWEPGFIPVQVQTLAIPATQADGATINVTLALVDINKDNRSVIVTVEAGGVVIERIITVPNKKDLLNIEEFALAGVPAGTDEVTITLESPVPSGLFPAGGDSMAMIGAAANYECGEITAVEPVAEDDSYTFSFVGPSYGVPPATDLLFNDSLGTPPATLVSFGGGNMGGNANSYSPGSLVGMTNGGDMTVNADGSWWLETGPFVPGTYTFEYVIQNASGQSTGTVTLNIQDTCLLGDTDGTNDC